MSGLPELAQHYSGLGLKCKVELQVDTQNLFGLKITHPEFVRINGVLEGQEQEVVAQDNWRKLKLPTFSEVPEELKRILMEPVVFKYGEETGDFEYVLIDQTEPEWSVNFKKALIVLLQTKLQTEKSSNAYGIHENMIVSDAEMPMSYWKTNEETLDGVCEVTYQINEIPTYMVEEHITNEDIIEINNEENCDKYFEITKTRDITSCTKNTIFSFFKPGFINCPNGECDGMWTRSSLTRYIACGTRDNLTIKTIVSTYFWIL